MSAVGLGVVYCSLSGRLLQTRSSVARNTGRLTASRVGRQVLAEDGKGPSVRRKPFSHTDTEGTRAARLRIFAARHVVRGLTAPLP